MATGQKGPQKVFNMEAGYSHWYRGFVSPNNVCGKVKLFLPRSPKPDKTAQRRIGELGITFLLYCQTKIGVRFAQKTKHQAKCDC